MAKAESKPQVNQATNNTEKAKALAAALAQIEKQFGKGSIMRLGNNRPTLMSCPRVRSAWTLRLAWAVCRAVA